jgi:hypothetical protein
MYHEYRASENRKIGGTAAVNDMIFARAFTSKNGIPLSRDVLFFMLFTSFFQALTVR